MRQPNFKTRVNRLGKYLLDTVAPLRCLYCDDPTGSAIAMCGVCVGELQRNGNPCPRCALPDCGGNLCPGCLRRPPPLLSVSAPLCYDPAVAYLVHRWKYDGQRDLAITAAILMLNSSILTLNYDIMLPTPLHWQRLLKRGFNQSDDLMAALCRQRPALQPPQDKRQPEKRQDRPRLRRRRSGVRQAASNRAQRLHNLHDAFVVRGDVRGKAVLLIDDVCTTGATGNAMAGALLGAGALEVHLWCLARTPAR